MVALDLYSAILASAKLVANLSSGLAHLHDRVPWLQASWRLRYIEPNYVAMRHYILLSFGRSTSNRRTSIIEIETFPKCNSVSSI